MKVPKQLENVRFIKTSGKKPIEIQWTSVNNYNKEKIEEWLKHEKTYGVLCGKSNIMVVDVDDVDTQNKLLKLDIFQDTFTVITATKKLPHFYFKIDGENTKTTRFDTIKDGVKKRIIDFQGDCTQVIGPNSEFPDGSKYTIVNDAPIKIVKYDDVINAIISIDENIITTTFDYNEKQEMSEDIYESLQDDITREIKKRMTIKELLIEKNIDTSINPTMCPLGHESEGGTCFSYVDNPENPSDTRWNCFHCGQSGDIFHLYQKLNNVTFIEAKHALAKRLGLVDEIKSQYMDIVTDQKLKNKSQILVKFLADTFRKFNNIYTLRHDKEPEMWIFKEGIYIPNARTYIQEFCGELMDTYYDKRIVNKVIDFIQKDTYIEQSDFFKNEEPYLVPVKNGIYNIETDELMPYTDMYIFFNKLNVTYDPHADCENIKQFFKDILHEEDIPLIQEIFGYCLYRSHKFHQAFMFNGDGRNGKGVTLRVLEHMLSEKSYSALSLEEIGSSNFGLYSLHGKLANIAGDLDNFEMNKTGTFKKLTGEDIIRADRKFLEAIMFRNYAKMLFSTNSLPKTFDNSDGFWDRWKLIDFPYKFVYEPTLQNEKLRDNDMIERLITNKEISGLFNWSLIGLKRLMTVKEFSKGGSLKNIALEWKKRSSSAYRFYLEELNNPRDYNKWISTNAINVAYATYCQNNNYNVESAKILNDILRENGHIRKTKFNGNNIKTFYAWFNIEFKHPDIYEEIEMTDEIEAEVITDGIYNR